MFVTHRDVICVLTIVKKRKDGVELYRIHFYISLELISIN